MARLRYELKGFRRMTLEPGETRTIMFKLKARELGYWNRDCVYGIDPDEFKISLVYRFVDEMERKVKGVVYVTKEI